MQDSAKAGRFGPPAYVAPADRKRPVATNEQISHANTVAMNEVKGKPRTDGYPVSNRSAAFKEAVFSPAEAKKQRQIDSLNSWASQQGFKTDWQVGLKKATGRTGV